MRKVGIHPLENGMTLYYQPDPGVHLAGVGVRAGSIHDPPDKRGMAHDVEHCVSRSSARFPDGRKVDLLFRKYMGGPDDDVNIRTDRVSTFYGCDHLLYRNHALKVFEVMASFVHGRHRRVDEEGVKKEFSRVHNEYCLRGIDFMEMLLDDLMHETMYRKNPARNRVDCHLEDLKTFTLEDVRRFLRRHYIPPNMFMVVLGPSFEKSKALANRYFADWEWESSNLPELKYDHSEDTPVLRENRLREVVREGINQFHCGIGFPTETYLSEDAEAIDILNHIFEQRLMWRLMEKNCELYGGTYRSPVESPRTFVHGMIWAHFATVSKDSLDSGEDGIIKETEDLKTKLVAEDEFDAAQKRVLYEYRGDLYARTPIRLCERIIDATCNGDEELVRFHAQGEGIEKVTRRKILAIANKYFTKHYARVVVRPAEPIKQKK